MKVFKSLSLLTEYGAEIFQPLHLYQKIHMRTPFALSFFLLFLLLFLTGTGNCDQKTITSTHFVVHYDSSAEHYAHQVSQTAEKGFSTITGTIGHKSEGKISITLTGTREEFRELTRGVLPDWSAAAAMPGNRIILSPLPGMKLAVDRILAHEIVHIILYDAAGGRFIPRWFHEGCAEIFSGQWGIRGRIYMVWKVSRGNLMTFEDIERVFSARGADVTLAYDQSMLAVKRLISDRGSGVLPRILNGLRDGQDFDQAFETATGLTLDGFEREYLNAVGTAYGKRTLFFTLIPSTWTFILILAIIVYIVKKRRNKRLMSQWEIVDAAENIINFRPDPPDGDGY